MKCFRILVLTAACAAGWAALQVIDKPVDAAQQSGSAGGETSPPAEASAASDPGATEYAKHCAICHGAERQGDLPGFPPLIGIGHQMSAQQIAGIIHSGKGRMPAFPSLQGTELAALLHYLATSEAGARPTERSQSPGPVEAGDALFHQNCAFCHGRDAMGGETGPDLTQSKIVLSDKTGEKIAAVVREGRPDNKMPAFSFSSQEMASLVAFIHARVKAAAEHPGGRRGVSVADLQTGSVDAGKAYFNGAGGCSKCHSASGDLAGIARRFEGLQLEQEMLYPRSARSTVTVTVASGEKISGTLAYRDEFTIGLRDGQGVYRSWPASRVRFTVDSPVDAHVEQFGKYTDEDIHNLMAYLQTLR